MAKKFVRGITDVKNIEKQDFDTNNVNDLLSDGEHNYIHRKKKNKKEEYHNLTNNIKTIDSDNTSLLSVTNYNNTKNSATLHPHHDAQKEQKLYSTDNTIEIVHGDNGTGELTNVDVNTKKVLTHDNLVSNSSYVSVSHAENSNTTQIGTSGLDTKFTEIQNQFRDFFLNNSNKAQILKLMRYEHQDLKNGTNHIEFYRYYYGEAYDELDMVVFFDKGVTSVTYNLGFTGKHLEVFQYMRDEYGDEETGKYTINDCLFDLNGFNLTVSVPAEKTASTPYVFSFVSTVLRGYRP